MKLSLKPLLLVAAFGLAFAAGSCSWFEKKVVTVADDVKTCFGPDVKGDLGDIVKGIGTALVCDVESGGNALPACTIEGLQTIAEEIGPSGKADVSCVVEKLAQDAAGQKVGASPEEVLRTRRAKLYVKARTLALRSPGDATPKAGAAELVPIPGVVWNGANGQIRGLEDSTVTLSSLSGDVFVTNVAPEVPMLKVAADWMEPKECADGSHSVTAFAPGAVCLRDTATWEEALQRVAEVCRENTIDHCTFDAGNPFIAAIFEMARPFMANRSIGLEVSLVSGYGAPTIGILYDAVAGNDSCNGRLAAPSTSDPMPNLAECLHVDDVKAALPTSVPDTSKPAAPAPETTEASGS